MTTDYHTPWQDGITEFKAEDMNAPLAELDEAIGTIYATLSGEIDGKADLVHNHDDDYYTKTVLSTSGEGAAVHWNNLTNVPESTMSGEVGVGVAYSSADKPAASAEINIIVPYGAEFPTGLIGSGYYAATAPADNAEVTFKKNGSAFGTLNVGSGEATGGTWSGEATFVTGDRFTFVFPAQDADWAGVSITVKGTRA